MTQNPFAAGSSGVGILRTPRTLTSDKLTPSPAGVAAPAESQGDHARLREVTHEPATEPTEDVKQVPSRETRRAHRPVEREVPARTVPRRQPGARTGQQQPERERRTEEVTTPCAET